MSVRGELAALRETVDQRFMHLNDRIDSLNARMDTVIDAIASLRQDFAQHSHDG